jgi:metal transporter CNNM
MLVTLLLCNAACLETLPIYLNKAVSELAAILFSVVGVLFAGEILP